jgi:hypothetical protein
MVRKTLVGVCVVFIGTMGTATVAIAVPTPATHPLGAAHVITPNPSCGTGTGETVCIQAYQNGLAFTWSGPATLTYAPALQANFGVGSSNITSVAYNLTFGFGIEWIANAAGGFDAIDGSGMAVSASRFQGSAAGFSYFFPLPAGEYTGNATTASQTAPQSQNIPSTLWSARVSRSGPEG